MRVLVTIEWTAFKPSGKYYDSGEFRHAAPTLTQSCDESGEYVHQVYGPGLIDEIRSDKDFVRYLNQGMDVLIRSELGMVPTLIRGENSGT